VTRTIRASSILLIALCACSGDGTLVVQVRSDLVPGLEFASVDVVVMPAEGGAEERFERAARDDRDWGQGVRVAETSLPAGRYHAVVSAVDQTGAMVVERPLVVELGGGELRVATVLLTRDCRGVECPLSGDDAARVACLAGRCVEPECSEETPELCGAPACGSAADCSGDPVACATRECTASGACVERLDHAACGGEDLVCSPTAGCVPIATGPWSGPGPPGHVHLSAIGDGVELLRLQLREDAPLENVSAVLDVFFPRDQAQDRQSGMSRNGEWLSMVVQRSGCSNCLLIVPLRDLSAGELVSDFPAIGDGGTVPADDGNSVIFIEGESPGIAVSTREPGGWSSGRRITTGAPHTFYDWPSISPDGLRVLFTCGYEPDGANAGICEVGLDGAGLVEWLPPGDPSGIDHPTWAADGSVLFHARYDSMPVQLWRLTAPSGTPVLAFPDLVDEHSDPCALADGRVVALPYEGVAVISDTTELLIPFEPPPGYWEFYVDGCGN
jgi:hypothetical protein